MSALRWAKKYRVSEHAVYLCGLDRLPKMGEDARAFMLRDWQRFLDYSAPGFICASEELGKKRKR